MTTGVPLTLENLEHFDSFSLQLLLLTRRWNLHPPLTVIEPLHYRIKTVDYGHIELGKMLTNWRLYLNGDEPWDWGIKSYCFNGASGLRQALTAGIEWSGEGEAPGRWYRAIHNGIRREEYLHG
jgi:hypothetical protein